MYAYWSELKWYKRKRDDKTPISVIFNQITWERTAYSKQVLQYFLECHQEHDAYSTSYRIGKDFWHWRIILSSSHRGYLNGERHIALAYDGTWIICPYELNFPRLSIDIPLSLRPLTSPKSSLPLAESL